MSYILALIHDIADNIVSLVADMGYLGILIMMFLESSFFPFPSEIAIIPAGYLSFTGEMNIVIVIIIGTIGSLLGAILNYFLALKLGRAFILKYGKYFFFKKQHLEKIENFFHLHGSISTFSGRLIIGIRQYISLPAGLSKMNFIKFCIYTTLGAFIWVSILAILGYYLGDNALLLKKYLLWVTLAIFVTIISIVIYYFIKNKSDKVKNES